MNTIPYYLKADIFDLYKGREIINGQNNNLKTPQFTAWSQRITR